LTAAPRAARIVAAVSDAAARWTDADFPPRVRATRALIRRTGYSEPVVDYALDRLFGGITPDVLRATIEGELGSLAALDGFVARPGRPDVYFRGIGRAAIVASQTTIGVAIPPLVFALCASTHVIVKDRTDALVAAFVETIVEEEPQLEGGAAVETWAGEDEPASRERLASADVVVAFGGDSALRAIRAQLAPHARFVPFGPRTSVGYLAREALGTEAAADAVARAAALDALLYDGDGCLSLHTLFVERGGALDPAAFARRLARATSAVAVEFPAVRAEAGPPALAYRRAALFRAAQGAGAAFEDVAAGHLVVYDPPRDEAPPLLPRVLAVYPVDGPAEALSFIERHALPIEGFARGEDARDDVAALGLACGANRLARFGTLQDPPLGGEHGGEGRILPFVRAIYRS
jgi:hypothetical protein